MENKEEQILERYRLGIASEAEQELVRQWIMFGKFEGAELSEQEINSSLARIENRLPLARKSNTIKLWPKIAAAASILLILSVGGYFFLSRKQIPVQTVQLIKNDVPPGHNQATLILANGQKIVLKQGLKGKIGQQGQTTINAADETIRYQAPGQGQQVDENTLVTAKGERSPYPLQLADGTKVWLNAQSSLTFPTAFPGRERIVKLNGEAFFEVAHNSAKPFKVITDKQTIEDLGTQFNIRSYLDDPASATTLVEGAIKVKAIDRISHPKPGEQVVSAGNTSSLNEANLKEVLAWKNGYFRFNDAPITEIMRELGRWYSIDVVYEGKISQERFTLKISRYKNISAVLRILEATRGVYFKVEGRRVTVLKKN